jgi:hypothetical protein
MVSQNERNLSLYQRRIGNPKAFFALVLLAARSRWRLRAAMAATLAPSGCGRQPRAARPSAA